MKPAKLIANSVAEVMDWHDCRYDGIPPESEWEGHDTTDEGNPLEIVNHAMAQMPEILERLGFERPEWVEWDEKLYSSNGIDGYVLNIIFIYEYNRRLRKEIDYYDVRWIAPQISEEVLELIQELPTGPLYSKMYSE